MQTGGGVGAQTYLL